MKYIVFLVVLSSCIYADLGSQIYTSSPPKTSYKHLDFVEIASFNRKNPTWNLQSAKWQWTSGIQSLGTPFK